MKNTIFIDINDNSLLNVKLTKIGVNKLIDTLGVQSALEYLSDNLGTDGYTQFKFSKLVNTFNDTFRSFKSIKLVVKDVEENTVDKKDTVCNCKCVETTDIKKCKIIYYHVLCGKSL